MADFIDFFLHAERHLIWIIGIFLGAGYFFGALPFVQKNMKVVILGIIIVSVLPIAWEFFKARSESRKS